MEADQPPDKPLTRNRARNQKNQKQSAPPAQIPATIVTASSIGDHDGGRKGVDNPLGESDVGKTVAAADGLFQVYDLNQHPANSFSSPSNPEATMAVDGGGDEVSSEWLQGGKPDLNGVDARFEEPKQNAGSFVDENDTVHLHVDENEQVDHKPMSFAEILKKRSNLLRGKGKLTYYPPVVSELGTRRAVIPDDLILKQASEWALTLAGYFLGKRPAFPFVQYHARRMWKNYGLTDVILNDQGFFFFKFNSEQGMNFVFENGPWLFNGMPIFIQKWQPGLSFDKPKPKTVPLWVNIYGLPLDVWDYDIISYIVSVVGEPVSVDRYTADMCETKTGRASFARVLVNASADFDFPSEIDAIILGTLRKFKVEFPWKPKRCKHCKVFGHDFDGCQLRTKTAAELQQHKPISVTCGGESSKTNEDGFRFPKRRNKVKVKQNMTLIKVGASKPRVAFAKGINERYVPKTTHPSIDPLDKGIAKIGVDGPSSEAPRNDNNSTFKVHNLNTQRVPMPVKVSNQFTVLEEHPKWTADKKEVDCFVEKRGVGLEPAIINSWSRQKVGYFIDRWERVFGKELDGKLRGFTLPERIDVGDDDDGDTSDDDVLSDNDTVMASTPKKVSWADRQLFT